MCIFASDLKNKKSITSQMAQKFYAPKNALNYLTITTHPGTLTEWDIVTNLVRMNLMESVSMRLLVTIASNRYILASTPAKKTKMKSLRLPRI